MTNNKDIPIFKSGVHNLLSDDIIPKDAASDSSNWYTQDGRIKLVLGRTPVGAEGLTGKITGEIFGYKIDGTKIHWRKAGTKIQYFDSVAWQDTVTGLTAAADYAFANYSSLAGTFTFAFGIDGIYKMHNAVPGSFNSMYNAAKNFKGKALIDRGRSILWDRKEDKTGLYGSYIDAQNATVYTTVTGEVTVSLGGTLAFKGGGATRNCFGVVITVGAQTFTDNYLGVLVGSAGGTGTINYISGVYTVSVAGAGTANYQWEDSNIKGVTDFTHTATRLPSEGFVFPQDEGGDPILNVLVGQDGAYYSLKSVNSYRLALSDDDTTATNEVYRKELGIPSYRAAVSTGPGIIFINVANPSKPEMTILRKNSLGDNVLPYILFSQFKFANYNYDDCFIDFYERYVIVGCRSAVSEFNDTILLCDLVNKTVDITNYAARTSARNAGHLYIGSPVTMSVYDVYNGFDDVGLSIENFWASKNDNLETLNLKKLRKIRLKGKISRNQRYAVYINYDDYGYQLVGTVVGNGSYVDFSSGIAIGGHIIGEMALGGDPISVEAFDYLVELRVKKPTKFRVRKLKFIALEIGYVDIEWEEDWDVWEYEDKIPARFRQKQNVSLDGLQTNLANPEF